MATQTLNGSTGVVEIPPALLAQWLAAGDTVLLDVREDFEHAAEHIPGAELQPLSSFDADALRRRYAGKRLVVHCRSGKRSADAAQRLQCGELRVFQLAGGLQAWKDAGLATEQTAGGPRIDVMRQTQITIGVLVLTGVLLGAFVSPWFLVLSGFMGAGLIFAGLSGACGMALVLARLPWNRTGVTCRRPG